jgi:hypothetical protein
MMKLKGFASRPQRTMNLRAKNYKKFGKSIAMLNGSMMMLNLNTMKPIRIMKMLKKS